MKEYSHRNGEKDYPQEIGFFFQEHPTTHYLSLLRVTADLIRLSNLVDNSPKTVHPMSGFYHYYGPIPLPLAYQEQEHERSAKRRPEEDVE